MNIYTAGESLVNAIVADCGAERDRNMGLISP